MAFKCAYCRFSSVASMDVRWDELEVDLDVGECTFHFDRALVVDDMERWRCVRAIERVETYMA